jgi:predicted alpha/beta hydrolase family esterase
VAPPDVEREDLRQQLPGWAPGDCAPALPFRSIVVASTDDPYGALSAPPSLGPGGAAQLLNVGARGHINADSGLGDWPEGHCCCKT